MTVIETAPAAYDVKKIRRDFPILDRAIYDKPLVYLDNGASAQKPKAVLDAIDHAYRMEYSNVHRGLHYLSNEVTAKYEAARHTVANFLNAPHDNQIIFTKNTTEAINLVASSYGAQNIHEGDEIVLSIMEHHSNIVPWHFHRERKGAILRWAPIDDDGNFLLEEFEKLLNDRTRIVAITHMSNALGTNVPVKEVCRMAHARGIPVLVDGSQSAVHRPVDVQDLECDFFVFTGHKTYGPSGIGALYARTEHLEAMQPYMGGGEMIESVTTENVTYGHDHHKFEAGTPPIVQAIGLGAALTYMMGVGRERIAAYEDELKHYAHLRLGELNYLRIYGNAADKGAIVSFTMEGLHPHDISTIIDRAGVAVRAGHHCAQPLMERFGITGTCRASMAMYNTRDDIDALVSALKKAHEFFA
ncbi:MAG: cysteine desulfurase [Hyphomicrobiaceae bacterium]